jgi:hypothetical protein
MNKELFYINNFSYLLNTNITIYLSDAFYTDDVSINIYCFNEKKLIKTLNIYHDIVVDDTVVNHNEPLKFIDGYNFKYSYIFSNNNLNSGLYFIELTNKNKNYFSLFVIIDDNISYKENLVLMNSNTWNAYNQNGGASFYRYNLDIESNYGNLKNSIYPVEPIGVTFNRPFDFISEQIKLYVNNNFKILKEVVFDHLLYAELRLLTFLRENNISFSLCTDYDIHTKRLSLDKYNNFILNNHPEYWSKEMTDNVILNANNIISFAGNVAYYVITYSDDLSKIYKNSKNKIDEEKIALITGSKEVDNALGYNTYYPYNKTNKSILTLHIKDDKFGCKSLNRNLNVKGQDGISGHETDKIVGSVKDYIFDIRGIYGWYKTNPLIASGLNPPLNKGGGSMISMNCVHRKKFIAKEEIDEKQHTHATRKIFSVGSMIFTGGLFIDKDIELLVKNTLTHFKYNKIFVFGYTKTASTSMSCGLQEIGLTIEHVQFLNKDGSNIVNENIKNNMPILTNIEYLDGIVLGESQYKYLDKIYNDYPNSKFIYLERDDKEWLESYKRHQIHAGRNLLNDDHYINDRNNCKNILFNYLNEKKHDILIFDHTIEKNYNKVLNFLDFSFNDNYEVVNFGNSLLSTDVET